MENAHKIEVNWFSSLKMLIKICVGINILLLRISILICLEFYGGKPELWRLF